MYWVTSHPLAAASARASPLAWPTDMAVRALTWKNTRSTATAAGASSAINARRPAWSWARRSGSGVVGEVVSTPALTARSTEPSRTTAP